MPWNYIEHGNIYILYIQYTCTSLNLIKSERHAECKKVLVALFAGTKNSRPIGNGLVHVYISDIIIYIYKYVWSYIYINIYVYMI